MPAPTGPAGDFTKNTLLLLSELLDKCLQHGHHAAVPLGAGDFERGLSVVDLVIGGGCTVGEEDLRGL